MRIEFAFAVYYHVMRADFGNSKVGDFVSVSVKMPAANRTVFMPFRSEIFRRCRDFVFPRTVSMRSKIDIDFTRLRKKRRIRKRSGVFHFAFFFAGCRGDYRSACGYRFAFDMRIVMLANSFRFADIITCPSIFYFAPVVNMRVVLFCIIIRYGLPAAIHNLVVSFCPNERMSKHRRWRRPIKLTTYRNRNCGFICIRHWSSVLEPVLDINVCVSFGFGVVVCKYVSVFVSHFESNGVAVI